MRWLFLLVALVVSAAPAMAQFNPQNFVQPCGPGNSGQAAIVPRPPTAAEIAAVPPALPGVPVQKLLTEMDHVHCDGVSSWVLDTTVPQFSAPGTGVPVGFVGGPTGGP